MTAVQALIDIRNQFNRYAEPEVVEWHFTGVSSRWTKRALVAGGFGPDRKRVVGEDGEKGVPGGPLIAVGRAIGSDGPVAARDDKRVDVEAGEISPVSSALGSSSGRLVPLYGINRPFFHVDLETALKAAIKNLEGDSSESN